MIGGGCCRRWCVMRVALGMSAYLRLVMAGAPTTYDNHLIQRQEQEATQRPRQKPCGHHRGLVLLWKLTDYVTLPREQFDMLFNSETIDEEITPSGSIQQYIAQNSLGRLTIEWTVADWVDSTKSESECAGSTQGKSENLVDCFHPSLDALEARHNDPQDGFDWNDYDLDQDGYIDDLVVIFNGYDGENENDDPSGTPALNRIFAHNHEATEGSWISPSTGIQPLFYATVPSFRGMAEEKLMRFNIALHQYIMSFGAIDLFDASLKGYGCGGYCIMAYDVGPKYKPVEPGNVGAYSRLFLGWGEPVLITEDGEYDVTPSFSTGLVYKIQPASYDPKEYLLIENRPLLMWDQYLFGNGGIVIWHVNENDPVVDDVYTRVRVVQADGRYDIEHAINLADEGDLWIEGLELGDEGDPNITSVVNGNPSGLLLSDFSPAQEIARFRVSGLVAAPPTPFTEIVCSENVTQVPDMQPTIAPGTSGNETTIPTSAGSPSPDASGNNTSLPTTSGTPSPDASGNNTSIPTTTAGSPSPTALGPMESGSPNPVPVVPGCIPGNDPSAPPIYDPRECGLSVGAEFCEAFLATINPDPSCDCHNFCDGKYVGCCHYSAACPINCPARLIAGCVFPSTTCPPTTAPTSRPNSMTGNGTPGPSTVAPSGSVEPSCMISASTGDCAALMRSVELNDSCSCYNFCNGKELPCCIGNSDCPALSCNGDFVAGCRKEDKAPAPRCLVQSNLDACNSYNGGQQYVGGSCDCANYCDGEFIGCCPFDTHCALKCQGTTLVAGCKLNDDDGVAPAPQGNAAPFFFWPDGFMAPKYDEGDKRRLLGVEHPDL